MVARRRPRQSRIASKPGSRGDSGSAAGPRS